jgi:phosphopantetheinyl transferase
LSHCRRAIACAVSDAPVGVDVQEVVKTDSGLAKHVLSDEEHAEYLACDNADEYFCRMWVAKESYLKLTGRGVFDEMNALSVSRLDGLSPFDFGSGYYGCAASECAGLEMTCLTDGKVFS